MIAVAEKPGSLVKGACYFAAFIGLGLITSSLGPTLPGLAAHTAADLAAVSVLFPVRSLGYLAGTLLGGRAYDRFAGHPVLAGVLVTMAAAMAMAPVATWLVALALVLGLVGVTEGMLDVGGNAMLVWEFRTRSGPFLNALHAFYGVGALLAPIVVARAIATTGDITWAYWVLAAALLPVSAWLLRLPSPAHPASVVGAPAARADWRLVALIALFYFVYIGSEGGVGGWLYTYTVAMGLGDEKSAAYLTSAMWGALTLGRLVMIPVAVRVRPEPILVAALAGGLAGSLAILAAPYSVAVLWTGTFVIGFALAAVFPTMLAFAGRHTPVTGAVTSWFFAGASAGSMVLPWVIGQFFEPVGPRVTFLFIGADLVATLVVLAIILAYVRRHASS